MPINIKDPIIVPQKTFDKYWVCAINISAPSPLSEATAEVTFLPFNSTTGEVLATGGVPMHIEEIMKKASENPQGLFAKAMYFLIAAINEEKVAQDAAEQAAREAAEQEEQENGI